MILVVNNAEPGLTEFVDPIVELIDKRGEDRQLVQYSELRPDLAGGFDKIILSASPMGDDIVDHHLPFYSWLSTYEKPVLGICAGHQIVGCLFGGELLRKVESEQGTIRITKVHNDALFEGYEEELEAFTQHHDSVTCPDGFWILARSDRCQNQIMRHQKRPIYGVQFHPEKMNHRLIENFLLL